MTYTSTVDIQPAFPIYFSHCSPLPYLGTCIQFTKRYVITAASISFTIIILNCQIVVVCTVLLS